MASKLKLCISLSLLAVVAMARAQNTDDYFHNGTPFYVFGEKEKAVTEVTTGLQRFPDDQKLGQLAALMKKEEEQKQNKSQQNKQDKNDEKKDQKDKQDKQDKNQQGKEDQKSQEQKDKEQ